VRIIVYAVFPSEDGGEFIHASFTKPGDFDVDLWTAMNWKFLKSFGCKRIEFEEIDDDDFRLEWESIQ